MTILRLLLIWMSMVPAFAVAASFLAPSSVPSSVPSSAPAGGIDKPAAFVTAATSALEHFVGDLSVISYTAPDGTCFHMEKLNPDDSSHMLVVKKIEDEGNSYYDLNAVEIQRKKDLGYYDVRTPFGDYIFFKNVDPIGTCGLAVDDVGPETDAFEKELRGDSDTDPLKEYKRPLEELSLCPEILDYLKRQKHTFISTMEFGAEEFYASMGIYLDPDRRGGGIGKIMNHMLRHCIIDHLVGKTCDFPKAKGGRFVTGTTSAPFAGSMSLVALDNLPSLASQLAEGEVSVAIIKGESEESNADREVKAFTIFYPPQSGKSSPAHLICAKEIIAMEKAHRASASSAAAATASGLGSASSA